MKRINVLVAILTTSDLHRCKRAIRTALTQQDPGVDYNVKVFINARDKGYSSAGVLVLGSMCDCIVTKSNGHPGLGKQSVMNWFMAHEEYDAIVLIDGDDFLYPYGLRILVWLHNEHKADVIGLQAHDMIFNNDHGDFRRMKIKDGYWLVGWYGEQKNHCVGRTYLDFTTPVGDQRTPDRLVWMTRRAFQGGIRPWFPVDLPVYEDYVASITCLAAHAAGMMNYVQVSASSIYCHDALPRDSTCTRFISGGNSYHTVDDRFAKCIGWLIPIVGAFGFNLLPYHDYPYDDAMTHHDRLDYVGRNLVV